MTRFHQMFDWENDFFREKVDLLLEGASLSIISTSTLLSSKCTHVLIKSTRGVPNALIIYRTRMHSSTMRTALSLPYRGVSVPIGGSLSRGVSVRGICVSVFLTENPPWTDRHLWKHNLCKLRLLVVKIWDVISKLTVRAAKNCESMNLLFLKPIKFTWKHCIFLNGHLPYPQKSDFLRTAVSRKSRHIFWELILIIH